MGFISIEYKCDDCKKVFKVKRLPPTIFFSENRVYCSKCPSTPQKKELKKDVNIKMVEKIIKSIEKRIGKVIPKEDVLEEARLKGFKNSDTNKIIQKLKHSGDLFEPRRGFIARI